MVLAGSWWTQHGDVFWGAVVGAAITLLVGFIFWKLAEKPARLDWCIEEKTPILNPSVAGVASATGFSNLRVMYGDEEVSDPYFVRIRILNTGKVSLNGGDFKQPIRIDFGGLSFLSSVLTPSAEGMILTIDTDGEQHRYYAVSTDLLKPGESLSLRFIVDGNPEIRVWSRIDKVKEIREVVSFERLTFRQAAKIAGKLALERLLPGIPVVGSISY
jgi:hypothetical protein